MLGEPWNDPIKYSTVPPRISLEGWKAVELQTAKQLLVGSWALASLRVYFLSICSMSFVRTVCVKTDHTV